MTLFCQAVPGSPSNNFSEMTLQQRAVAVSALLAARSKRTGNKPVPLVALRKQVDQRYTNVDDDNFGPAVDLLKTGGYITESTQNGVKMVRQVNDYVDNAAGDNLVGGTAEYLSDIDQAFPDATARGLAHAAYLLEHSMIRAEMENRPKRGDTMSANMVTRPRSIARYLRESLTEWQNGKRAKALPADFVAAVPGIKPTDDEMEALLAWIEANNKAMEEVLFGVAPKGEGLFSIKEFAPGSEPREGWREHDPAKGAPAAAHATMLEKASLRTRFAPATDKTHGIGQIWWATAYGWKPDSLPIMVSDELLKGARNSVKPVFDFTVEELYKAIHPLGGLYNVVEFVLALRQMALLNPAMLSFNNGKLVYHQQHKGFRMLMGPIGRGVPPYGESAVPLGTSPNSITMLESTSAQVLEIEPRDALRAALDANMMIYLGSVVRNLMRSPLEWMANQAVAATDLDVGQKDIAKHVNDVFNSLVKDGVIASAPTDRRSVYEWLVNMLFAPNPDKLTDEEKDFRTLHGDAEAVLPAVIGKEQTQFTRRLVGAAALRAGLTGDEHTLAHALAKGVFSIEDAKTLVDMGFPENAINYAVALDGKGILVARKEKDGFLVLDEGGQPLAGDKEGKQHLRVNQRDKSQRLLAYVAPHYDAIGFLRGKSEAFDREYAVLGQVFLTPSMERYFDVQSTLIQRIFDGAAAPVTAGGLVMADHIRLAYQVTDNISRLVFGDDLHSVLNANGNSRDELLAAFREIPLPNYTFSDPATTHSIRPVHRANTLALKLPTQVQDNDFNRMFRIDRDGSGLHPGTFWYFTPLAYAFADDPDVMQLGDTSLGLMANYGAKPSIHGMKALPTHEESLDEALVGLRKTWTGNYPEIRRMLTELQQRGVSLDESMSVQWMAPNTLYTAQVMLTAMTRMLPVTFPASDAFLSQVSTAFDTLVVDDSGKVPGALAWYNARKRAIGVLPTAMAMGSLLHEMAHAFDASLGMLVFRKAFYTGKQIAMRGIPGETGHDLDVMDRFFRENSGKELTHANIRQLFLAIYRFSYIDHYKPGAGDKFDQEIMGHLGIKQEDLDKEFEKRLLNQQGRARANYRDAAREAIDSVMADHILPRHLTDLAHEILKKDVPGGSLGTLPTSSSENLASQLLDALKAQKHDKVRELMSAMLLGRFSRQAGLYFSTPVESLARLFESFQNNMASRLGQRIGRLEMSTYGLADSGKALQGYGPIYMTEPHGVERMTKLLGQLFNNLRYDEKTQRLSSGPIDMTGLEFNRTPEPVLDNAARGLANRMLDKHGSAESKYEHDPNMEVEPSTQTGLRGLADPVRAVMRPIEDAGETLLVVSSLPVARVTGALGRKVFQKLRQHSAGPTVLTLGKLLKDGLVSHDRKEIGALLNDVRRFIAEHTSSKTLTTVDRLMHQQADFPIDRQAETAQVASEEMEMTEAVHYRMWDHFGAENIMIDGKLPPPHGSDLVSPAGMIKPNRGRIVPITQQIGALNIGQERLKEIAASVSGEEIARQLEALPDAELEAIGGGNVVEAGKAVAQAMALLEEAAAAVLKEQERTVVKPEAVKRAQDAHEAARKALKKAEQAHKKARKEAAEKGKADFTRKRRDALPDELGKLVNITEKELFDIFYPKGNTHADAPSQLQVQTVVMALSNTGIDPLGTDAQLYRVKDRVALPQMVQNQPGDPEVDYTAGYLSALGTGSGKTRIIATLHRVRSLVAKKRLSLFLATTDTPVFDAATGKRKLSFDELTAEEHMDLYDTQSEYRQMVTSGVMLDLTGKAEGVVRGFVKAMGELGMIAPELDKDGKPTGELVIQIDDNGNVISHRNGISDGGTGHFRLFRFGQVDDGKILDKQGRRRPEFYPRPGDAVFIDNYELAINQNPGFLRRMFPPVYGMRFEDATEKHKAIRAKAENWAKEIAYAAVDPPANFLKMLFLAGADVVQEKDGELVIREDRKNLEAFSDVRAQLSFDEADIAGNVTTLGINVASGRGTEGLAALVRGNESMGSKSLQPSKTAMMVRELGRLLHKSRVLYSTATPFKDGYRIPFLERVLYMINPNAKEVDPTILAALVRARPKIFRRYMTQMLSGLGLASFAQLPIRPEEIRVEQMNIANDDERLGHLWSPFQDNPQLIYDEMLTQKEWGPNKNKGIDYDLDLGRVFSLPRAPVRSKETEKLVLEAVEKFHSTNRMAAFTALGQIQPLLFQAGMLDKVMQLGVRLMEDNEGSPITVVDKIGDAFMKRQMALAAIHGIDDIDSMLTMEAFVRDQWMRSMPIFRLRPLTIRQERRGVEQVGNTVVVGSGKEAMEVTLMRDTLLAGEWIDFLNEKHKMNPKVVPAALMKEIDKVEDSRKNNPVKIELVEEGKRKVPYLIISKRKGGKDYAGRAEVTPQVLRLVAEARNVAAKANASANHGTKRPITAADITFDVMADGRFEFRVINSEMYQHLMSTVLDKKVGTKQTLLPIIEMQVSDRQVKLRDGKKAKYSDVFRQLSSAAYSFKRDNAGKLVATPRDHKAEREKALQDYQSNQQIAMLTAVKSASRGIDMHQIKEEWPQRSMIIFEPGPDGGAVVQMLGRINRTGAKGDKLYIYPNTNYGAYMTTQWDMLSKLVEIAELSTGNREMMLGVLPNFVDLKDLDMAEPVQVAMTQTVTDWFNDPRRFGGIDPVRGFKLMSLLQPPPPPAPGQPPPSKPFDEAGAVKAMASQKSLSKASTLLKNRLGLLPLETQREFLNTFMHSFHAAVEAMNPQHAAVEIPGKVRQLVELPARTDSTGARQQLSIVEHYRGMRNWFTLSFNELLVSSDDAKREAKLEENREYYYDEKALGYIVVDKNVKKKNVQVRDPFTGSYTNTQHYRIHQFSKGFQRGRYEQGTDRMWHPDYAVDKWSKDMPIPGARAGQLQRVERSEAENAWKAAQGNVSQEIKDRTLVYSGNPLAFTPVLQTDFGQMRYFNENLKRVSVWSISLGVGAIAKKHTARLHGTSKDKKKRLTPEKYVSEIIQPRLKAALSLMALADINDLNDQLAQAQSTLDHEEVRKRMLGDERGEHAMWFEDIGVMVRTDTHGGLTFNMLTSAALGYVQTSSGGGWQVVEGVAEARAVMSAILKSQEVTDEMKLGLLQLMFSDFKVVKAGTADYREAVRYIKALQGASAVGGPSPGTGTP